MYKHLILISLITACGTDEKKQAPNQTPADNPKQQSSTMSLAVNASDIPECSDSNKNQLIYVTDLKQFQTCDTAWVVIETPAGKDGATGKDGSVLGAKSKVLCHGDIGTTGLKYYYELTDMQDGGVYVFGSILDTTLEASASRYHLPGQIAAKYGTVGVIFDLTGTNNSGGWTFRFVRETAILSIYVKDEDLVGGMTEYVLPAAECAPVSN